jgi:addiction module RelB/DinJ family antitoxin
MRPASRRCKLLAKSVSDHDFGGKVGVIASGKLEKGGRDSNSLGLTASDAIRLFYRQVALRKGLPFDVKLPNAETRRAMKKLDEGKDVTRYDHFDDFRKAMMGADPWPREKGPAIAPSSRLISTRRTPGGPAHGARTWPDW